MSTTHTTVGAVVGMSLVLQGAGAVNWNSRTDTFPYYSGISTIVSSWCGALGSQSSRGLGNAEQCMICTSSLCA